MALAADQQGRYVLVVDGENKVRRRNVVTGTQQDNMTAIKKGLEAGERAIVSGLQRARPGMEVKATESEKKDTSLGDNHS